MGGNGEAMRGLSYQTHQTYPTPAGRPDLPDRLREPGQIRGSAARDLEH